MANTYQIYLISDSTGETLDRIFLALKAQFKNIDYKIHSYSFTRTENQILKILENAEINENSVCTFVLGWMVRLITFYIIFTSPGSFTIYIY